VRGPAPEGTGWAGVVHCPWPNLPGEARRSDTIPCRAPSMRHAMTTGSRPIVIAGLPRSGTTWTLTALSEGVGIRPAPERDNEDNNPSAIHAKRRLGRYPLLSPGDVSPAYRQLWDWILSGAYEPRRLAWARWLLGPGAKERIFEGKQDVAAWLAGNLARNPSPRRGSDRSSGDRRVIAKSIHTQLAIDWLASEFDVDVLVLLRHPANVLASWMQVTLKDSRNATLETRPEVRTRFLDTWDIRLPGPDPVEQMCWRICLLTAALEDSAQRHPDWHVRTHEDLCDDPVAKFKSLCVDLDLEWSDARADYLVSHNTPGDGFKLKRVAEDLPNSWEQRLDDASLETLRRVLGWFPISTWTVDDLRRTAT